VDFWLKEYKIATKSRVFDGPVARSLLFIWPIRLIGISIIILVFVFAKANPSMATLNSDKNQIALLENGIITTSTVVKSSYEYNIAAFGWNVIYEFNVKDPRTGKNNTYSGNSQGPAKYYRKLSKGDKIDIIYEPSNPKINSEIKCFLNDPSYRWTFKKAGKLNLLDRFRDKYELEEYSFEEWNNQKKYSR
jgi:hypothetical protein